MEKLVQSPDHRWIAERCRSPDHPAPGPRPTVRVDASNIARLAFVVRLAFRAAPPSFRRRPLLQPASRPLDQDICSSLLTAEIRNTGLVQPSAATISAIRALRPRVEVDPAVQHQPAFAFGQFSAVLGPVRSNNLDIPQRIAAVAMGRDIHQMRQQPGTGPNGARQMLNAQARAFGSASINPGMSAITKPRGSPAYHAQIGVQGGEGVVGHLRRRRTPRRRGGFAGVQHPHSPTSAMTFQLQPATRAPRPAYRA